jgi:surfactin family lipopeptide synthetase A
MRLTLPQQDIFFEQLLFATDPIYNIGAKIAIRGPLNPDLADKAYQILIQQHDAYRITIDSEGKQQIVNDYSAKLQFLDFSEEERAEAKALEYMDRTFKLPFKFQEDVWLHKFILIKVAPEFHYLFSVYHHIITDGWGTSLMFQRLVKNYNELLENNEVVSNYPFSYQDFVTEDEVYQTSDLYNADKEYWKQKFSNLPDNILLKKGEYNAKSARKELIIERDFYNKLAIIAREQGGSTFHLILATLYTYFSRISQNTNFAIGLPVLNRNTAAFKKTVGLFMGVSPLLFPFSLKDTFGNLIKNIRTQLRVDYRHQRFPLGKIIKELGLLGQAEQMFNITLSYEKQNYADHFANTKTTVIPLTHEAERVALALYIREFDEAEPVKIDFDYNLSFFDESTISVVVDHIQRLLNEICKDGNKKLNKYHYLSPEEENELLYEFNNTAFTYSDEETVVSLIDKAVKSSPGKVAVQDGEHALSYSALNSLSDKVADFLMNNAEEGGCQPVAVLMPRSVNLVVALLGVLKSGRAYIPLDPAFPEERIRYIIEHSKVGYVISDFDTVLQGADLNIITLDAIIENQNYKPLPDDYKVQSSNTAYIIYTSGSTGNPKGVAVPHAALANFLLSIQSVPGIKSSDTLFSVTTQSFDISALEFYLPLISGATLHICQAPVLQDPKAIMESIRQIRPEIIQATPSFYQMLINAGWQGNRKLKVLCGGDAINADLIGSLLNSCGSLWNMYGPTETTIWSSIKQITTPSDVGIIGKPINNTQFYILDASLNLLPKGSIGDIWIGGHGLAQGYYNDQELTERAFIDNPYRKGARIYRTGDKGRWTETGEIEFFGRNDYQIKVRGYRIEPGEIESKINRNSSIKSSVIIAHKQPNHNSILVAFVSLKEGGDLFNQDNLIAQLRKTLPEYMVPHKIIVLDQIPLTPNNKVDRKLLSTQVGALESTGQGRYVAPNTEMELMLCNFCQDVLQLPEPVGAQDNFFAIGGHSLNAVKLLGRIEKQMGFHLTLKDIFERPIIKDLASYLEGGYVPKTNLHIPLTQQEFYPVTQPQYAIWLAGLQGEKSVAYNMFMAFEVKGELDYELLQQVFKKIIEKHEALRTNFIEYNGYPHQKISMLDKARFATDLFEIGDEYIDKSLEEYVNQKFALDHDLLLRIGIFKGYNDKNILAFVTHHIVMDGWSLEILIKEVVERYQAAITGKALIDKVLKFQFKDYANWQEKLERSSKANNAEFWQSYLKHYTWKNLVPYDHTIPTNKNGGTYHHFNWDSNFLSVLEGLASRLKVTLHNLLVGAFYATLYSCYDLQDICIGTINSGRSYAELHNQIGMYVKTLPLRIQLGANMQFSDLALTVQNNMLLIDKHQDIPQEIFSNIRLEAILVLQNQTFDYENIQINDRLKLSHYPVNPTFNRLPLLINFTKTEGGLHGSVHYDTGKYQPESLELLIIRFEKMLNEIIANNGLLLGELDIYLPFEEEDMEIDFNF